MEKNGAQIILEVLHEHQIDTIFGYPGGAVIPFYHELYDQMDRFQHVRTSHEQGAVHAADGYSRSTGKLGVCVVTSGPGVTNTITGIATAYMDSAPLLVISGQVPSVLLGKDSFQEVDITGIAMPVSKYTFLVRDLKDMEKTVRKAIKIATSGRPGPVLIDIPKDLFIKQTAYPSEADMTFEMQSPTVDMAKVQAAVELINASEKPIVYAGGGIRIANASEALRTFCLSKEIPIVNTLMSLGTFPRKNDLSLGMVGMHGYPEANLAITHSDLIIAIGARFSDRVIGNPKDFAPNAKVVHIDFDLTEFSKNIDSDIDLCGSLNEILEAFNERVVVKKRQAWIDEIVAYSKIQQEKPGDVMTPKNLIQTVAEGIGDSAVIVTDVGQHQMWTAQYYPFSEPRQFITSGGLGTMGFGLGAAIGTKLGNMDKPIVLFTGDGSFRMNCNELATVSGYNLPILIVLMNNHALGMVRQWQKLFQGERYAETTIEQNVDYCKLAGAYGIESVRADDLKTLEAAVRQYKETGKALFVECTIDQNEDVYPIVPPGQSIDKYILR
ncbi:MAG: acetolactate synthase large subunit [Clostridiales bacterium]|jgi:acetolactate synthase-1/2/3 large subunit|nr:acetolactate synthase large subunit [Clostridiales bacterium]MDN5299813.1 acetolactate synthase large subunit [Clostridiales bacterium]